MLSGITSGGISAAGPGTVIGLPVGGAVSALSGDLLKDKLMGTNHTPWEILGDMIKAAGISGTIGRAFSILTTSALTDDVTDIFLAKLLMKLCTLPYTTGGKTVIEILTGIVNAGVRSNASQKD
jgi:hypothetical protein